MVTTQNASYGPRFPSPGFGVLDLKGILADLSIYKSPILRDCEDRYSCARWPWMVSDSLYYKRENLEDDQRVQCLRTEERQLKVL